MSPQSAGKPQVCWIYDPAAGRYFWYDFSDDTVVYNFDQGVHRVQRPSHVPRSALRSPEDYQAYLRTYSQQLAAYSSSPTGATNYTHQAEQSTVQPYSHASYRSSNAGGIATGGAPPNVARSSASTSGPARDLSASFGSLSVSHPDPNSSRPQNQGGRESTTRYPATSGPDAVAYQNPAAPQNVNYTPSYTQRPSGQRGTASQSSPDAYPHPSQRQPVQPHSGSSQRGASTAANAGYDAASTRNVSQQGHSQSMIGSGGRSDPRTVRETQDRTAAATGIQPAPVSSYTGPVTPQVYEDANRRVVDVRNPENLVRTFIQTGPTEAITDRFLFERGVRAHRLLLATGQAGETEQLFSTFKVRETPRRFFTIGKVFLVLWVEPAGEKSCRTLITSTQPGTTTGRYGEKVFSKVRRFVVIREGDNYCSALPIATYGKQGVGKDGVNKSEHGIIHTGRSPPQPLQEELAVRGERGMRPIPIRVDPDVQDDKLDPLSRIDYGKVHTIQHNIKVKSFGKVNSKSDAALHTQFQSVWEQSGASSASTTSARAGSSRGSQAISASAVAATSSGARSPANRVSTGHGSQATRSVASNSSRGRREAAHPPTIAEDDDDEDEDDDDDDGEDEDSDEEDDNGQRYRSAIAELMRRGYTQQSAIQYLRDSIARQRRPSRGSQE